MPADSPYEKFASVVLDIALNKALDYGIPLALIDNVCVGSHVSVPVRGRATRGYILELKDKSDYSPVQPVIEVLSDDEIVTPDLFELALWMSKYYCTPLSSVLRVLLPASVRNNMKHKEQLFVTRRKTRDETAEYIIAIRNKNSVHAEILDHMLKATKGMLLTELMELADCSRSPIDTLVKKGLLAVDIVRVDRSPLIDEEYFQTKAKTLNEDQAAALAKINGSMEADRFETHLLYGVTGSGKTEVYLQAIETALKQGKGTIMLVPEIALTAQTIERFRSRFEGSIAVLHHRLSAGERFDEWKRIKQGKAPIAIGARSAIFSPVKNLGLIIVDEEHESSYKQTEEHPAYHARDVAVMRGKMCNATVVLGSATPSLESFYNAKNGKYTLSTLHNRADAASMPKVTIVDMKHEFDKAKGYVTFSDPLLEGIKRCIEKGEQVILFLNRRGYHTSLVCKQCGNPVKCTNCDVSLTFHKGSNILACHLCGLTHSPPPTVCPGCSAPHPMKYQGIGTELVEKSLQAIFPEARTLRVDADTTKHKGSHQKLLRAFGTGKADILIGTQMIAKGLHFPAVTLVGVLNTDSALNIPDFRASETVFQLITQVAGRAGRGALAGEVLIQTHMPDNKTILLASKQEYEKFYEEEIAVRTLFGYPPTISMIKIGFYGEDQKRTHRCATEMQEAILGMLPEGFHVHPVMPCGYAKVKNQFRFQFLIRGPSVNPPIRAINILKERFNFPKTVKMHVDVNPVTTYF